MSNEIKNSELKDAVVEAEGHRNFCWAAIFIGNFVEVCFCNESSFDVPKFDNCSHRIKHLELDIALIEVSVSGST